jgi:hypothetical protein
MAYQERLIKKRFLKVDRKTFDGVSIHSSVLNN